MNTIQYDTNQDHLNPCCLVAVSTDEKKSGGLAFLNLKDILPLLSKRRLDPLENPDHILTIINALVSKFTFGIGKRDSITRKKEDPRYVNRKDQIEYLIKGSKAILHRFTGEQLKTHFLDDDFILYFSGNDSKSQYSLLMWDFDCYENQPNDDAIAVAHQIGDLLGGNHYILPSNSGCHMYSIVDKNGQSNKDIYNDIKSIEKELNDIDWGIKKIELKGSPTHIKKFTPRVSKIGTKYNDIEIKMGSLATMPVLSNAQQIKQFLNVPVITTEKLFELVCVWQKERPLLLGQKAGRTHCPTKRNCGSFECRLFKEDELAQMICFEKDIEYYLENYGDMLEFNHKGNITLNDIKYHMSIVRHCTKNISDNGQMPSAWIEAIWRSLYEAGDIDRHWCDKKHRAIRDWLERLGVYIGIDKTYNYYPVGHAKHGRGKAMCWHMSDTYMEHIDAKIQLYKIQLKHKEQYNRILLQLRERLSYFNIPPVKITEIIPSTMVLPIDSTLVMDQKLDDKEKLVDKIIFCNYAA